MVRAVLALALVLVLVLAPRTFASGLSPVSPPGSGGPSQHHVVPPDAAARVYLAQALASLGRAEQLAQQAGQYGDVGTLDVERFLGELRAISEGLRQVLVPDSREPGPHVPVEITGQYLYDGLARRRQPRTPAAPPLSKEPRP